MEAVSVEARSIELSYGTTKVLRDISFTVARSEVDYRREINLEPIDICVRMGVHLCK